MTRRMQYRGDREAEWASYSPDTREIAGAFIRGINAWVEVARERPPEEFRLAGWKPEFWHPADLLNRTDAFLQSADAIAEVERRGLSFIVADAIRRVGVPPFLIGFAAPVHGSHEETGPDAAAAPRLSDDEIAALADGLEPRPYSSREFLWEMGKIASKDPNSLVGACYRKGIPYFIPALNDSSIGIALAKHHHDRLKAKKTPIAIDAIKDNYEITQIKVKSPRTGVFYVGGGTPKNYISQVEVIQEVLGYEENPHWWRKTILGSARVYFTGHYRDLVARIERGL